MRVEYMLFVVLMLMMLNPVFSQDWQLVWQDEFDTAISDDWFAETGYGGWGWGNDEWQYYTPENAVVEDSCLVIRATVDGVPGKRDASIKSARLKTQDRFEFEYGKIEARIKLERGKGLWPAFWMLGSNINEVSWPACGEIDIMENVNGESIIHGTAHWEANNQHASYGQSVRGVDIEQFHTYTVVWDQQYIRWQFNGQEYHRLNISSESLSEFRQPFYIILNLAVGGQWPGPPDSTSLPAEMHVDYVRVYMNKGARLGLDPYSLDFAMDKQCAAAVSPQSVTLVNTGSDTLANVTVTPDVEWLDIIWLDHEGNEQLFDVVLGDAADELEFGRYSAYLTVNAENAPPDAIAVELQVGTNIVLNNIARASSVQENVPGEEEIKIGNVNDGNMETRWISQPGAEQWVTLDLNKLLINKQYNISMVNVNWGEFFATDYDIQISNTRTFDDYTVIANITGGDGGMERVLTDNSISGKYIRLYAAAGGEDTGYIIYELEVYGSVTTGVNTPGTHMTPREFHLTNAPNPFNPVTSITFTVPDRQNVNLAVFDVYGRHVATLASGVKTAGNYRVNWNAQSLSSGVYICRLTASNKVFTRKLMLLK